MFANALHCENGAARGVKAKAGWPPGELLQRSEEPFSQQPEGNGRPVSPLCVAFLAKTASLSFVKRLDWHPMPPVRIRRHSVNRPCFPDSEQGVSVTDVVGRGKGGSAKALRDNVAQ